MHVRGRLCPCFCSSAGVLRLAVCLVIVVSFIDIASQAKPLVRRSHWFQCAPRDLASLSAPSRVETFPCNLACEFRSKSSSVGCLYEKNVELDAPLTLEARQTRRCRGCWLLGTPSHSLPWRSSSVHFHLSAAARASLPTPLLFPSATFQDSTPLVHQNNACEGSVRTHSSSPCCSAFFRQSHSAEYTGGVNLPRNFCSAVAAFLPPAGAFGSPTTLTHTALPLMRQQSSRDWKTSARSFSSRSAPPPQRALHAGSASSLDATSSQPACTSIRFLKKPTATPSHWLSSPRLTGKAGADQALQATAQFAFQLSSGASPGTENSLREDFLEHGSQNTSTRQSEHLDGTTLWIEDKVGHLDQVFRGSRVITGLQPSGHLHLGNYFSVFHPLPILETSGASVTCLVGDLHASFGGLTRRSIGPLRPETLRDSPSRDNGADCSDLLRGPRSGHGSSGHTAPGSTAGDNVHSESSVEDTKAISDKTLDAVAMLLATGIHPDLGQEGATSRSETQGTTVVAVQSLIPEHTVLATLLMGTTPLAWLERCTGASANIRRLTVEGRDSTCSGRRQETHEDDGRKADVGMRFYPLLMAADILSHDTDYVLVGGDQRQHVEFTRQVARRWNRSFLPLSDGDTRNPLPTIGTDVSKNRRGLRVPRMISYSRLSSRIGDLQDPGKKMSKSSCHASASAVLNSKGCVFLLDPPDVIAAKIAKAKTDTIRGLSYSLEDQSPQLSGGDDEGTADRVACRNLLHLWCAVAGEAPQEAASRFTDTPWECFKKDLTERVIDMLIPVQRRYREIRSDIPYLRRVIDAGAKLARQKAVATLQNVREAMTIVGSSSDVN
ncbi:tryptophanyl-tRNA synthetase (TrpRS1) [Toxoplasma gondii TgCatPRC2]|uniref:Tryptophanyl-tRNA synthetase (TrpRS1) n=1 Tax=Toxoplasma gondii TgCatPRC2 TaxID=1130821 RepID=A0A151HDG7_TOXGO|nr:tryptophanyl-tRNA synthetase (TrpRS1) [Toxoplasma gondii TgCatPRC2]